MLFESILLYETAISRSPEVVSMDPKIIFIYRQDISMLIGTSKCYSYIFTMEVSIVIYIMISKIHLIVSMINQKCIIIIRRHPQVSVNSLM